MILDKVFLSILFSDLMLHLAFKVFAVEPDDPSTDKPPSRRRRSVYEQQDQPEIAKASVTLGENLPASAHRLCTCICILVHIYICIFTHSYKESLCVF